MKTNTTRLPIDISGDITRRFEFNKVSAPVRAHYQEAITCDQFDAAVTAFRTCFLASGLEDSGMALLGGPGVGKSKAARVFTEEVYSRPEFQPTDELTPLPVLSVRVPGKCTIPRLIEKLLESARHLAPAPRSGQSAETRLNRLIENQYVMMIIFDEFQHLLRRYTKEGTKDVVNFIKNLMGEHKLAIAVTGLPETEELLFRFPELRQRLSFVKAELKPFSYSSSKNVGMSDFASYLNEIDALLDKHSIACEELATPEMVHRIWLASRGLQRHLHQLINRILIHFGATKSPITNKVLQQIYDSCPFSRHVGHFQVFEAPEHKVIEKCNQYNRTLEKEFEAQRAKQQAWQEKYGYLGN